MIILPFATFVVIVLNVYLQPGATITRSLLRASMIMGALITLSNVLLSIFRALTTLNIAIFWSLVFILFLCRGFARLKKERSLPPRPRIERIGLLDGFLLAMILIIVHVTLIIALIAPVQTYDSLTYHMSRVAHWVQNRSVSIYPTGIERQADMGPYAEFAVLHLYILQRGDRFVNLVDWFAFIGCLIASASIANRMGADRRGRLIAALFVATLPMAIAQASSTMTDIVVAYWVLCMIVEILDLASPESSFHAWAYLGLAAGLAILTKATAVAFVIPFLVWLGFSILRQKRVRRVILPAVLSVIMLIGINIYTWTQNYVTYRNPIGSPARIEYHANQMITPAVLVSNVTRNIILNLSSNNEAFSLFTFKVMVKIHLWIGLDPSDPRTTLGEFHILKPSLSEDGVGNPYHLALLAVCILIGLFSIQPRLRWYGVCAIITFLLFSIGSKAQIFAIRLQTPFFIIAAPIVGTIAGGWKSWLRTFLAVFLFLASMPILFSLQQRPIIPLKGRTASQSILTTPRSDLYFSNSASLTYFAPIVEDIQSSNCSQIGLMLGGDDPEYLWWVLLGAPWKQSMRLEWMVSGTPTDRFEDSNFKPCAVICTSCPEEWNKAFGIPLKLDTGNVRLFISSNP